MFTGGGLSLKREGDKLILYSQNSVRWFGVLFGGFAVIWTIGWINQGGAWFGLLIGIAFAGIGGFLMLPRTITTTFDTRSRRVHHNINICNGWYQRSTTYSFAEIAGVGVKEYNNEGYTYMPIIKLKGGGTRW